MSKASDSGYKSDNSEAKRKRLGDAEEAEKKKKKQKRGESDDDDARSVASAASARRKKRDDDGDEEMKSMASSDDDGTSKKKKSKKKEEDEEEAEEEDSNKKKKKKKNDDNEKKKKKKEKDKKKKKERSPRKSDSETESDASTDSDGEYQTDEDSSSDASRSSSDDDNHDGSSSDDGDSDKKKKKKKKQAQSKAKDAKKTKDKKSNEKDSGTKTKSAAKSKKQDEDDPKKKDKNSKKSKKKLSSLEEVNEDASDSDDGEERKESKDKKTKSKASEGDNKTAKATKGRGGRKAAATTLSWNDAVRKLWPEACQDFLTDDPSYEKVSDNAEDRPLSILHVPLESGIEESLSSRSISEFLLHRSDNAFTHVMSSPQVTASECKLSFTKDGVVWKDARTFKKTEKEEQKVAERWNDAWDAANSDETWTLPQMKKAKSLHIPNISVSAFGDETVENATVQLASMVNDVCATTFTGVSDRSAMPVKQWDSFADNYNHGILVPGHGKKACTLSIKSGITCTLFSDHVGWSSAAHYMTHKSKGVALWIGVALTELDDAFAREDILKMMQDVEIDNVLTAILDIKQKERSSLCHVWQKPGDVVYTPGGKHGYAYIVMTAGPLVEQMDFYRTYTTSAIHDCLRFWNSFNSTSTLGGIATSRVLPTHRLQYENNMALGLQDNLAKLKSICEHTKPNTLDKFMVVKIGDTENVCDKCDQPASFVYYKNLCEVCLVALSDKELQDVQNSKEGKSSANGKSGKSNARRGGAAASDTKSRGRKLSGRHDSPERDIPPVGNAIYFTDDELTQAQTLLCWQSLLMFVLDTDVVGICRCITCQKLRKEAQPSKELTSSKCCWEMLRQNRVPLNLVQGTCLCAKCKTADARVGDRSSQLVGNVSASAAAASGSGSSSRAQYENIPALEKR